MAVSKVKKANFFTHICLKEELIKELQKVGCIQIKDITSKIEKSYLSQHKTSKDWDITSTLSEVKYCIDYFSHFKDHLKKSDKYTEIVKKQYNIHDLKLLFDEYEYKKTYDECKSLDAILKDIKNQENYLSNLLEYLSEWKDINIKMEDMKNSERSAVIVGTVELKQLAQCISEIDQLGKEIAIVKISENKKYCKLAIVILHEFYDKIRKTLNKFNFNYFKIPVEYSGSVRQIIKKITKEIKDLETKKNEIKDKSLKIYEENYFIYVIFDYLSILKSREDAERFIKQTEHVVIIEGWVLEKDQEKIKNALGKKFKELEIIFSHPKKNEDIPVALKNNNFVEPFESVTELYGIPQYHEFDPTPLFSPFYFIFFGMCLSDAGYGLIITILSFIALKKIKLEGMAKKFFGLFFLGGISTFFIGALMGSWMGDAVNYFPESMNGIRTFLLDKVTMLNPIENPMPLLIISLILGVIQIYTGFIIKFIANLKNNKLVEGLMDQGSWMLFISGILFFIITSVIPMFAGVKALSNYVIYLGLIAIILTQGRGNRGIVLKIAGGVISLYDTIGYFSDILSYSRLFALGLSTAVLAVVVNNFVMLFKDVPFLGIVIAALVFIIGHVFNMAISGMGAFIHSTRLQYVEFFTKFYEGGGSGFKPFKSNTKYIDVTMD